jgi:hypothetical protein
VKRDEIGWQSAPEYTRFASPGEGQHARRSPAHAASEEGESTAKGHHHGIEQSLHRERDAAPFRDAGMG